MREEILALFRERGMLLSSDGLGHVILKPTPLKYCEEILPKIRGPVVTKQELIDAEPKFLPEQKIVVEHTDFKPLAKEHDAEFKEFEDFNVTGKSMCEGKVDDFVEHFRDRFRRLSGIIKERGPARDIEHVKRRGMGEKVRIIGMVSEIKTTKNGHRLISLEDETDTINVLVPQSDRQLIEESHNVINDEVIAIDGKMSRELFIANAIIKPDIPLHQPRRTEESLCVGMMSDTHIGSLLFMRQNFEKFIDWMHGRHGNAKQRELAGRIKYITIAGDLVDGVGIYPNQEYELETTDIFEQYRQFKQYLEQLPDYVEVVLTPGNHDAVRTADPQPAMSNEVTNNITSLDNVNLMSSPGYCSLHGVEFLLYHGASIHSIVPHVKTTDYVHPEKVCVEYLQRRHLHPVYGERPPITPEKKDYMVIERVPDVMQVADVHRNGYITYKGVIGVNAGCWQKQTPYQLQKGHHPTPCILPILDLHATKLSIVHFDKEVGA
ncbi:MAG: DNA-directed DNA polymerase II small subunit [Candidatus Diapherotrites archaeon]|nr:DNA-directed DNA polymerase II small subunit [Candidatus Diapherotrites archaeon]